MNPRQQGTSPRAPHPLVGIALGIFLYMLWLHFHLFVRSNSQNGYSFLQLDDSPVKRKPPKTRAEIADMFHLQKLATELTASFSALDGIPSDEREGFELEFQGHYKDLKCSCDVVSVDCLHVIACMKDMHNPQKRHALAWLGIELRRAMKVTSEFRVESREPWKWVPLGKLLQYKTIHAWMHWRLTNVIPEYKSGIRNIFIKPELYVDCMGIDENGKLLPKPKYKGPSCFYQSPKDPENTVGTMIEGEAMQWYNATRTNSNSQAMEDQIRNTLEEFLERHQLEEDSEEESEDPNLISKSLSADEYSIQNNFSPLGSLMMFAHLTRTMFNRRPFLDKIYQDQLTAVVVPDSGEPREIDHEDPFIVSVHMRRGDSCSDRNPNHFERDASPLDSPPQSGNQRLCYRTQVYLDAVERIRKLVPRRRPLHVYLSTDDVGNIMHEIFTTNFKAPKGKTFTEDKLFGVDKWHFLNITRGHFDYKADSVEAKENAVNQPMLGETAVADLWLLSHGHAFVGHLGSRFGKVAWLLATARRNSFVPFFSVDGHSFCCEIDESCGKMKPFVTVNNCLTFGHEYLGYKHKNYWEEGSTVREEHYRNFEEPKIRKRKEDK